MLKKFVVSRERVNRKFYVSSVIKLADLPENVVKTISTTPDGIRVAFGATIEEAQQFESEKEAIDTLEQIPFVPNTIWRIEPVYVTEKKP